MTKKDYELIASWVRYCMGTRIDHHAITMLAGMLKQNKKFDQSKFYKACGIE